MADFARWREQNPQLRQGADDSSDISILNSIYLQIVGVGQRQLSIRFEGHESVPERKSQLELREHESYRKQQSYREKKGGYCSRELISSF